MKAVMLEVPEHILDERRKWGGDRWDELWGGVLHMVPPPTLEHQELEGALVTWLRTHWEKASGGKVYHQVAVALPDTVWTENYRLPDLVLLAPAQLHIVRRTHLEGAPTVAVEIRSPGDESYEKLPFYAQVGISEVWFIDRDTKVPQLFVLAGGEYQEQKPTSDLWCQSQATGIELRATASCKVAIRLAADPSSAADLPDAMPR